MGFVDLIEELNSEKLIFYLESCHRSSNFFIVLFRMTIYPSRPQKLCSYFIICQSSLIVLFIEWVLNHTIPVGYDKRPQKRGYKHPKDHSPIKIAIIVKKEIKQNSNHIRESISILVRPKSFRGNNCSCIFHILHISLERIDCEESERSQG